MDGIDEDEQLRRAIELSLQESQSLSRSQSRSQAASQGQQGGSEEDEEAQFQRDLAAAIEASKAEAETIPRHGSKPTDSKTTHDVESNERADPGGPSFLSERAKMERERLERVERMKIQGSRGEKRGRGEGDPSMENRGNVPGLSSVDNRSGSSSAPVPNAQAISPPTKRQRSSPTPPSAPSTPVVTADTTRNPAASVKNGKEKATINGASSMEMRHELFWDGELRQIANRLVDRDKDSSPTFRLSEIIGPKSEVTLAILSSYSNNVEWMYTFFDPAVTPIIVVNQPGDDGNSGLKQLAPNMLMTKPFIRNGRGCMHTKIMLFFYKDGRLRVAVPTANFVEYDWRDIENTAWVQDVPIRQTTIRHDPKAADFPGTLQRVLHTLNVPAALTKFLDDESFDLPIEALSELRMRWDWSKVRVKLVPSIAGKHEGWEQVLKTGHPALMKAVQELGACPPKGKQLTLECQGSSIGTYSTQWMNEFHCSARGESAKIWLDRPRSQRAKLPWPPVKILFPSLETVKGSVLGIPGGGTMFCRKAQWEAKNFPRELFYDSNSKRGRVLMHSKMIIGYFTDKSGSSMFGGRRTNASKDNVELSSGEDDDDDEDNVTSVSKDRLIGWAYIGSHNFTPSAWGTLSGSGSTPSLNLVNYELGIVLPLRSFEELERVACWKRPPRKYVNGVDRPWMQDEMREGLPNIQD